MDFSFNFPYLYLDETESTNVKAQELIAKINPPHGFVVITDYQTAGKGQYGRNWHSEKGKNLLFSIILYPHQIELRNIFRLHLVSSLALLRSFSGSGLKSVSVKWPNDIYVLSKKMAGILVENQIKGNSIENSVIGIGINVNQSSFPPDLNASSFYIETGTEYNRIHLLEVIYHHIMVLATTASDTDWETLLHEYNDALYCKDQLVSMRYKNDETFSAIIRRVSAQGKLIVEKPNAEILEFDFGETDFI